MAPQVKAVLFDVFGTLVDWRTSVRAALAQFGATHGHTADWTTVTDDWRAAYQPAMEEVRSGRRAWTVLDVLHRETLATVLARHGIRDVAGAELDELTMAWHRLDPWPDVPAGLRALRSSVSVGTMSNGNTALLSDLAEFGDLTFDHLLGAETALAYKPLPAAYLTNVARLGLDPPEVMLVAAHNHDLAAAASLGLRTCFIPRPTEHGPAQTKDRTPDGPWDLVVRDVLELARRFAG